MGEGEHSREVILRTANRELGARVWGPVDGPPILALHGWLDNAASFDGLASRLRGFRIVCLDLPGHGRSDHNGPGHLYPFMDLVADCWRAAESLGWQRFSLLGHSLGAGVACILAGTFPEQISRVVLLDGLGPLSETVEGTPDRFRDSLRDESKRGASSKRSFPSEQVMVERLQVAGPTMKRSSSEQLVGRGIVPLGSGVEWAADSKLRVASRMRLTEPQVLEFLSRIEAPTLVVRPTNGWPADPDMMQRRLETIAGAVRVELPGHHHVHMDEPDLVAGHVLPFLRPLLERP